MAVEFQHESDFIDILGKETFAELYNTSMQSMKAYLEADKTRLSAPLGFVVDLHKLVYQSNIASKWLFTEFCWEIKSPPGSRIAIETWFGKSIMFDDGENMDQYFDRYNQLKEYAEKVGASIEIVHKSNDDNESAETDK